MKISNSFILFTNNFKNAKPISFLLLSTPVSYIMFHILAQTLYFYHMRWIVSTIESFFFTHHILPLQIFKQAIVWYGIVHLNRLWAYVWLVWTALSFNSFSFLFKIQGLGPAINFLACIQTGRESNLQLALLAGFLWYFTLSVANRLLQTFLETSTRLRIIDCISCRATLAGEPELALQKPRWWCARLNTHSSACESTTKIKNIKYLGIHINRLVSFGHYQTCAKAEHVSKNAWKLFFEFRRTEIVKKLTIKNHWWTSPPICCASTSFMLCRD